MSVYPSQVIAFLATTNLEISRLERELSIKISKGDVPYNDPIISKLEILRCCQNRVSYGVNRKIFDDCVRLVESLGIYIDFR